MSTLTQELTKLKQSNEKVADTAQKLIETVAQKQQDIQAQVNDARGQFDSFVGGIREHLPLPPNLFSNSFMRSVEEDGRPTGFSSAGCTIEAVHPYTKGFEGPYTDMPPSNTVDDNTKATKQSPYWYARYNKGPILNRGGLSGGWNGISDGKILKIISQRSQKNCFFLIPCKVFGNFTKVGLRFWYYLEKGKIYTGVDSGLQSKTRSRQRLENETNIEIDTAAGNGWYLFDRVINISNIASIQGFALSFGLNNDIDNEVYMGLPYLYVPLSNKGMMTAAGETAATPIFDEGE